ncbi:fimbrial protein, partial [Entomohabitans teleogrylli]|uniref:fimbrial protein n=1 Tax=Entomohabitans teleogrylli TaxID=1384589 RepID=UPI00073D4AEE
MPVITLRYLLPLAGICASSYTLADATVNFRGTLIEAPPCVVNNDNMITVNFGNEIMTTRVDGSDKKPIEYELDCSNAVSSSQKVRISGTVASFDPTALAGGKTGLGIALYNGNTRLTPGTWVNFIDPNKPNLSAALIKQNGVTLSG